MIPRADLLALTPDDLASLSNRGIVKRAQKELESGEFRFLIQEEPENLRVEWSDGIVCQFPAGKSVHEAICSSGTLGISRHVIRSVLAYQTKYQEVTATTDNEPSRENMPPGSATIKPTEVANGSQAKGIWDPGAISDEDLLLHFRKSAIIQARKRFEEGVLVELTRGAKPIAHFLDDGCTVRFMVPGDLRYISADCAESLLPIWVPLAVWAFRELPEGRLAGIVSRSQIEWPVPKETLLALEALMAELFIDGLHGISDTWPQRLSRLEHSIRTQGLIWPAELITDLLQQCEMYRQHDARFEPPQVVQLLGELTARRRAIQNNPQTVPQPLIRGTSADRATEIAGGRMVGIGLGVRRGKRHTTISTYLQDAESGSLAAVERTFADPDPKNGEQTRTFTDLADTILVRGVSLARLATSQLLLKSGKRTPGGQLILPRIATNLVTNPQSFQWEQLKAPLAVENFAQLSARLESLPPSCLRPRRCTENVHVVPVQAAAEVRFDVALQQLVATLRDTEGQVAELVCPYHSQADVAFNSLYRSLNERGSELRFVSGHVRVRGRKLQIRPIALVFDGPDGRQGILPCVHSTISKGSEESTVSRDALLADEKVPHDVALGSVAGIDVSTGSAHLADFLAEFEVQLSELMITGLKNSQPAIWEELAKSGQHLGLVRWTRPVSQLANALTERFNDLRWDSTKATPAITELCLLSRLISE
jgi:hypothetical protein